jgi:hypothetical protein
MNLDDLICKCGHEKRDHGLAQFQMNRFYPCRINIIDGTNGYASDGWDGCFNFKQDNLKYLEYKYESKRSNL